MRDVDIAAQFGVTRERVRQVRKMLRKPRSDLYRARPSGAVHRVGAMDTDAMTLEGVAEKLGVCRAYAGHLVARFGKRCRPSADRRTVGMYMWDIVSQQDWRTCRERVIAEALGVKSPGVVSQKRIRLEEKWGIDLGKLVRRKGLTDSARLRLKTEVSGNERSLLLRAAKMRGGAVALRLRRLAGEV